MIDLYECRSCGFLSTFASEFKLTKGVFACLECNKAYGKSPTVTEWVDAAARADAQKQLATN